MIDHLSRHRFFFHLPMFLYKRVAPIFMKNSSWIGLLRFPLVSQFPWFPCVVPWFSEFQAEREVEVNVFFSEKLKTRHTTLNDTRREKSHKMCHKMKSSIYRTA